MKNLKRILVGLLAACLVLTGCLALAESEDSALEPVAVEAVAEPEVTEEVEQPAEVAPEAPAEAAVLPEAEPAAEEPALTGTAQTEAHEHDFFDGVCEICGYECPHTNVTMRALEYDKEGAECEDFGDEVYHHVKYNTVLYYGVCEDCDQYYLGEGKKVPLPGAWVGIEEHDYEDGVCVDCGHVAKEEDDPEDPEWGSDPEECEHKNLTKEYIFDYDNATYKAVDNRVHTVTTTCTGYFSYCEDCHEVWEEDYPEPETQTFESKHFYEDDVCVECGHKNTCEHKNIIDEGWIVEKGGIEVTYQQIAGNDKEHYLAGGSISRYIYCADCGENFWWQYESVYDENGDVPFDKPVTQAHYFENGVCVECGYVLGQTPEEPELQIDLAGITKTNATTGNGAVKVTKGAAPTEPLYARVTWVYTLSNGDSFAYCAVKAVKSEADTLTFNMVSPKAPYGATLDAVQVALVTDGEADSKGSYEALATARK